MKKARTKLINKIISRLAFIITIYFVAICLLIGISVIIIYKQPEISPAKWELATYTDEAGNDHYITACPRCQSTWEFHIDVTRINYCPTCSLRLEGVGNEK